MNRYEEQTEILAIVTSKIDRYGRIGGLKKYRGRAARVLILLEDPQHPMAILNGRLARTTKQA